MEEPYLFTKNYHVKLKSKPQVMEGCIVRELVIKYNNSYSSMSTSASSSSSSSQLDSLADLDDFEFTQFHITNWPDHGVPDNVESIVRMLSVVRQKMYDNNRLANDCQTSTGCRPGGSLKKKKKAPLSNDYLAVHCSAGCGRTGTIIAIDQIWTKINENVSFDLKLTFISI